MSQELIDQFDQPDLKNDKGHGHTLLPGYLSEATNLKGYSGAFLDELQELSDVFKEMFATLNIDEATGIYLDLFGKLLGLDRTSGDDETYRQALKSQISELLNSGQISVLKKLFKNLTGSTNVKLYEHYPSAFRLEVTTNNPITRPLRAEIDKAKAAGVAYSIVQAQDEGVGQSGYFSVVGVSLIGQPGQAQTSGGAYTFGKPNVGISGFSKRLT